MQNIYVHKGFVSKYYKGNWAIASRHSTNLKGDKYEWRSSGGTGMTTCNCSMLPIVEAPGHWGCEGTHTQSRQNPTIR